MILAKRVRRMGSGRMCHPSRRSVLAGLGATLAAPAIWRPAVAATRSGAALRLPELRDTTAGSLDLTARPGATRFLGGAPSATMGFDADYLGPTLRMRRGQAVNVLARNAADVPVSIHWHGLDVPSNADGGAPQSIIAPGQTWSPRLEPEQAAATLWYHTHVHGRTAPDVAAGLAGAILLEDDAPIGQRLPRTYGRDDLVLVLQDKRFDGEGRAVYEPSMMDVMHGFVGDAVLANGQRGAQAVVPAGPVRLRLINAATAAAFRLAFADRRAVTLIATDRGLLPTGVEMETVRIAPGERIEIMVDLNRGGAADLVAEAEPASGMGMGGMMGGGGGMMGGGSNETGPLLTLLPDPDLPRSEPVPDDLTDAIAAPSDPVTTRRFVLDEGMGPGQMMRGLVGRGPVMTINGEAYDPDRMAFTARLGTVERWLVSGTGMSHPFHAHGVRFLVENPTTPEETGWKDVVEVGAERALLVEVAAPSVGAVPFMFHCHILEHEDAGMMGQFLVQD